jgi:hypothetical protein
LEKRLLTIAYAPHPFRWEMSVSSNTSHVTRVYRLHQMVEAGSTLVMGKGPDYWRRFFSPKSGPWMSMTLCLIWNDWND